MREREKIAKLVSESLRIDGFYLNLHVSQYIYLIGYYNQIIQYLYIHAIHQSLCDLMFFTPI